MGNGSALATRTTSVLVIGAQDLVREGIVRLIERDERLELLGHTADPDEALDWIARERPAAVVLDIRIAMRAGGRGLTGGGEIPPGVKLLLLAREGLAPASLSPLLTNGLADADGLVLEANCGEQACDEIVRAGRGDERSPARVNLERAVMFASAVPRLSERQRAVLVLAADGHSLKEIGERLHLSRSAVKDCRRAIREKLDAPNTTAAVATALRLGLLE